MHFGDSVGTQWDLCAKHQKWGGSSLEFTSGWKHLRKSRTPSPEEAGPNVCPALCKMQVLHGVFCNCTNSLETFQFALGFIVAILQKIGSIYMLLVLFSERVSLT